MSFGDADSDEKSISQETLDLLVDDELGENDRRELLLRVDRAADGWRKCAIAFLEAQLFRRSFRSHDQTPEDMTSLFEPDVPADVSEREMTEDDLQKIGDNVHLATAWEQTLPKSGKRLLHHSGVWKNIATVTSLCLATLVLGGITVHWWESQHDFPPGKPSFFRQTYATYTLPGMFGSVMSPTPETTPINFERTSPNMEYVSLPSGNSNVFDERVPCFSSRDVNSLQYLKMPPGISPEELQEIKRSGGDVDIRRSHFVVPAGPGRHAIIPVDQVDVHYANKKLL